MAGSTSETPVLELLRSMTAESVLATSLDDREMMLVRIAALVAVDAPALSYLFNLEAAAEIGIELDRHPRRPDRDRADRRHDADHRRHGQDRRGAGARGRAALGGRPC